MAAPERREPEQGPRAPSFSVCFGSLPFYSLGVKAASSAVGVAEKLPGVSLTARQAQTAQRGGPGAGRSLLDSSPLTPHPLAAPNGPYDFCSELGMSCSFFPEYLFPGDKVGLPVSAATFSPTHPLWMECGCPPRVS